MPALLHELIISSAAESPEKTAIAEANASISYRELVDQAAKIATKLRKLGITQGDRIGLLAHKNIECYAALYGILMAGCAYVPLDRRAPGKRLGYIVDDCDIKILVCTAKGAKTLQKDPDSFKSIEHVVLVDSDDASLAAGRNVVLAADIDAAVPAGLLQSVDTDLAYVLYTSGSTGAPKGVMISHAVSMSFVRWATEETGLSTADRVSGHAPLHFDLSIFDIFSTHRAGATLLPVPDGASTFPSRLTDWMIDKRISVWYSVPSILSMMAKQPSFSERQFPDLRMLVFAGEVFPAKYLKTWLVHRPGVVFKNWYGPTETNVITSYTVDIPAGEINGPVPIGTATKSAALFRVDTDGELVTDGGTSGELLARGPCVAIGYWGDAEKTRSRFVENSQQPWLRDRVYRTGDLVTVDESGNLIFQGRVDHQVKCRGYRIELGEIEAALYKDQAIQEAAVIPIPDDLIGNRLIAFVASPRFEDAVPTTVVDNVKRFVPPYMVPDRFVTMRELPKTSNGKIDRQKLLGQAKSES